MTRPLILLCLPAAASALVPHKFWHGPAKTNMKRTRQYTKPTAASLQMYFDDCERRDVDDPLWYSSTSSSFSNANPWIMSMSEEKRLAMEKLLGYNPVSAAKLTRDQVEEETLRWAVDTNIVWAGEDFDDDDEDDDDVVATKDRSRHSKYDSIKDLRVASSCETLVDSLAFVWSVLADALQQREGDSTAVQLIVFPRTKPLWNYDTMVNMLVAIQICKPFLPPQVHLQLDLFHPNYKHSPRMWSPEMHAPFPTLGISLQDKTKKAKTEEEEFDVDATRAKLDALFQSMDGSREYITTTKNDDHAEILQRCMQWIHSRPPMPSQDMEWTIQMEESPFLLYKTLWNTILTLNFNSTGQSMVVVPSLDSHTLHRVAITVNAALIRLDIPVRITQVYTPKKISGKTAGNASLPPPYGMIQLSPVSSVDEKARST